MALVLTRKPGESITIVANGKVTRITLLAGTGERRLAFDAPADVVIVRSELLQPGEIPQRTVAKRPDGDRLKAELQHGDRLKAGLQRGRKSA